MSAASLYLLVGEPFLADEALAKIRAEEGTDPLSEDRFDPTSEPAAIRSALETPTLLGGRRLVVVDDAGSLVKDQIEALGWFIETPAPDVVLVLVASGRTRLDPLVKKAGRVVSLEVPKGRRLVGWLRQRAGERGLKLDDRAGWALIDAVGGELRDLDGALSQLATQHGSGAKIGAPEVRRAFSRLADERIFALTDALGERRLPVAMTALRRLLNQGDEPLMILGALTSHVRRLLAARRYVDAGPKAVGDALGLPGWRAEKLHRQARSYKEEELVVAMSTLAATDVELKSGGTPEHSAAALERAVTLITT